MNTKTTKLLSALLALAIMLGIFAAMPPQMAQAAPIDDVMIDGGEFHTLALKSDGTVWAWGRNNYGQLGDGTLETRNRPVQVMASAGVPLTGVTAIAAGQHHSLALKGDGTIWSWGRSQYGQLGDGYAADRTSPVQVKNAAQEPLNGFTAIAAGSNHSLGIRTGGAVWGWGYNAYGQLGDNTTGHKHTPVQVRTSATEFPTGITAIAAGHEHSLALRQNGTVLAWGHGSNGRLGHGGTGGSRIAAPVMVTGSVGLTGVKNIAAGGAYSLAVANDGRALAWGSNSSG